MFLMRSMHGALTLKTSLSLRQAARRAATFYYKDLEINLRPANKKLSKPDFNNLKFGHSFSDHMFECTWTSQGSWGKPQICPLHDISLHPAAKVLHYAEEAFEGMKAYRGANGKTLLFRPKINIERMLRSAERLCLPLFQTDEVYKCILKLVQIDREWVPDKDQYSLYIRPTFIGIDPSLGVNSSTTAMFYIITSPVGAYYSTGIKPVSLLADPQYVRSWPGGTGDYKLGSNYAPTILIQNFAEKMNCDQVLWLFGPKEEITEAGSMNVFMYIKTTDNKTELITAPLNGTILPGVTRQSVLELTREWNEFPVTERLMTMEEFVTLGKEKRLLEMFGTGTAAVISPVGRIAYRGEDIIIPTMESSSTPLYKRLMDAFADIQYGKVKHPWSIDVDEELKKFEK